MAFARWDPLHDLLTIRQQLDRSAPAPSGWRPPVDLREAEDRYVLVAEVPGLQRSDIQIQMQDDRLTLSGVRRECGSPCEQYHRVERGHGQFSRTFQLPHPIDQAQITADLKDGVLTVDIPKVPPPGPRRISVS